MKQTVLGLDLALGTTGWACFTDDGQLVNYGEIKTPSVTKTRTFGHRLKLFQQEIIKLLDDNRPVMVVAEDQYVGKFKNTLKALYGVRAILELECTNREIPVEFVSNTEVKRSLAGSGRASKSDVHQAATSMFHLEREKVSEDEADAMGIGYTYLARGGQAT